MVGRRLCSVLILSLSLLPCPDGVCQESDSVVFHVRDYGAIPNGPDDCGPAIRQALQAAISSNGSAEVVFDEGIYRVRAAEDQRCCFPVAQADNVLIRGTGNATKIVVTNPANGVFSFSVSRRVGLRDITIDYDPVPFCQGVIRAVDVEQGHFDLDVAPGYSTPDAENFVNAGEPYGKWGMIIDPATRRIRANTPDHYMTPRWLHRQERVWRFFTNQEHYRQNLRHMQPGNAYVHLARGYGAAISFHGCEEMTLENVTVHASPGLAVGLVGNRGRILVRGLEVRFPKGTDRLLTTNADGVHCQQNRNGPVIEQCYFEGMADDAINIYAPPNVVREVRSPTQWLVSPQCLVLPGDRLQVLDPKTAIIRGEVQAVNVAVEGRAFLLSLQGPLEGVRAGTDHRSADTLYNLSACGAGFQIRKNVMNGNRRYGCLLRAGAGVVEDNRFEDTTGAGVVITNEPDWPEGPMPWNITVRNNSFVRGGTCLGYANAPHGAALCVRATRLGHRLASTESIRGIKIESNEFVDRAGAAIYVGGAADVTLLRNRVTADVDADLRREGAAVIIDQSRDVDMVGLNVLDPRPGTAAAVEILAGTQMGPAGVRVEGLSTQLAPDVPQILDRRSAQ
jgi:hypothetical protein